MNWDSKVAAFFSVCGGVVVKFLGGWDILIYSLIIFMMIDFLLGVYAAAVEGRLSADIGINGGVRKVLILVLVGVGVVLDGVLNTDNVVRSMVILWYISFEGISILENAARSGLPIPDELRSKLLLLRKSDKEEVK